ncbi:MAG: DUF6076 domain-containing protein [Eubacterium sp.]
MEDRNDDLIIDLGLPVIFDGVSNTLLYSDIIKDYPVGGMISEYSRLHPTEIKDVILDCDNINEKPTIDNLSAFFYEFNKKLLKKFDPIIAIMVLVEFFNNTYNWYKLRLKEDRNKLFDEFNSINSDIKNFIFENTQVNHPGDETILQLILTMYLGFAQSYVNTKYIFTEVIKCLEKYDETKDKTIIDTFISMYIQYIDFQHIDYRIICTEKGFESLYTIKTSMSLLLFEMANCIKKETIFVKCINCGEYFVPEGRRDTLYCSYISPQNDKKTCKEIGAQITRANKEKTDIVTGSYRKTYMRYKMKMRRNPYNKDVNKKYEELTHGIKEWRCNLNQGYSTVEEYLNWIEKF